MLRHIRIQLLVVLASAAALGADSPAPRVDLYGDPLPPGVSLRIGTVRWRHYGIPHSIQFSPDGRSILSCDGGGACVRLWEAASGKLLRTYLAPATISSAALSPDGTTVAIAAVNLIQVLDLQTGKVTQAITTNERYLRELTYSPDGKRVAGSGELAVGLWDLATGKLLLTTPMHHRGTHGLAFSPNGDLLACCFPHGLVQLWDLVSQQLVRVLTAGDAGNGEEITTAAFTPDGRTLAVGGARAQQVPGPGRSVEAVAMLRLLEVASGKSRIELEFPDNRQVRISSIVISPDGKTLLSFSENNQISRWRLDTGERLQDLKLPVHRTFGARSIAISPDGKYLAAAAGGNVLALWDLATGQSLHDYPDAPEGQSWNMAQTADGSRLAVFGLEGAVRTFDTRTAKQERLIDRYPSGGYGLAMTPDGKRLVTATLDSWVRCYDPGTGASLWREQIANSSATGVAISNNGRLVATAHPDRQGRFQPRDNQEDADYVQLWEAETGKQVRRIMVNLRSVGGWIAFSRDDKTLFAYSWGDPLIGEFEVETGKKLRQFELPAHKGQVRYFHLAPEHKLMATGAGDGTVLFTELEKGTAVKLLEVSPGQPCCIAISPDGKHFATSPLDYPTPVPGKDRKLTIWDLATFQPVRTYELGDDVRIFHLRFSPDGKQIVTGTSNCTILFWDWQTAAKRGGK